MGTAAHQLVATMDSILPTHRSRISHSLHGYRDGSSTLPALHQLHLDAPSPPGNLVKHCAARLSNGEYSGLDAFP
jgi:hypothetical protein